MGSYSLRQAVIYRPNFQFGFQYLEAALNIRQRFVALDYFCRLYIFDVGDHQQFAVHHLCELESSFINGITEQLVLEVYLDDVAQMALSHLVIKARLGSTV